MSYHLIRHTLFIMLFTSSLSYGFEFPEIHFPLFVGPETNNSSLGSNFSTDDDHNYGATYVYNTVSPVPIFHTPWYYTSGDPHHVNFERPTTVLGNSFTVALGTAIASIGTLVGTYGFCALIQALFLQSHYKDYKLRNVFIGRMQDGTIGLSIVSVGLILTLFGANEIKESIKRIYQIYTGLPLDEDKRSA